MNKRTIEKIANHLSAIPGADEAFLDLWKRYRKYEEALMFYANPLNYLKDIIKEDFGNKAIEALENK